MSNQKTAYEFGRTAFETGMNCVPAADAEFLKAHIAGPVGSGIHPLTEWLRGWNTANIEAPIPQTH